MKDIDKELDTILTNYYRKTIRVDGNTPNSRQEAKQAIKQLINQARIDEVSNLKVAKLNLDKFTTDHADGYQMAIEDMNYKIEKRIAKLKEE